MEPMIDNAAAALSAAAMALPELVPASIAIPAISSKLPIVSDHSEAGTVLRYLLLQLHSGASPAIAALPQILLGCASALLQGSHTPPDVRESVVAAGLRHFHRIANESNRAAFALAVASLPSPELQAAVASALQHS